MRFPSAPPVFELDAGDFREYVVTYSLKGGGWALMISARNKKRYERQAEVVGALAHPIRIAIADLLKDGEQCVNDIAEHVGAERSNISRHLSVMLKAGVVRTRREGVMVFYELRTPCILNFLACASDVLRHNLDEEVRTLG
jgi:DNA-binding transcriptional ArsR family regulator